MKRLLGFVIFITGCVIGLDAMKTHAVIPVSALWVMVLWLFVAIAVAGVGYEIMKRRGGS